MNTRCRSLASLIATALIGCSGLVEGEPGSGGGFDELPSGALIASTTTILQASSQESVTQPGGVFSYSLQWNARPMAEDYLVFVHFVDAAGTVMFGDDFHSPEPTSTWSGPITHARTVAVPSLSDGTYAIMAGLYQGHAPWDRVELARARGVEADEEVGRYIVGSFRVEGQPGAPTGSATTQVLFATPAVQTVGAGDTVAISLAWDAVPMSEDLRVMVHLIDSTGKLVASDDYWPPEPTSTWSGRMTHERFLIAPAPSQGLPREPLRVLVGLYQAHEPWERVALAHAAELVEDAELRYQVAHITVESRVASTLMSHNGKCLELHHDAMPAYANTSVYLAECNGGLMQGWLIEGDRIKSAPFGTGDGAGLCLSRMPSSTLIWAEHCGNAGASRWQHNGGELYEVGSYTATNPTGSCIKAYDLTYNPEQLRMVVCSAGADPRQQWRIGSQ